MELLGIPLILYALLIAINVICYRIDQQPINLFAIGFILGLAWATVMTNLLK